jgi:hypothetical protein
MDEASIFLEALHKPAPEERAAFLDQACAGNDELRRNIEMLLKAHVRAGDFLAQAPARSSAPTSSWSRSAKAAWARCGWHSSKSRSSAWWR